MLGNANFLHRSTNLLHVMGSVTVKYKNIFLNRINFLNINYLFKALCCVDKKGILSWPNPTAEKVFFLQNSSKSSSRSSYIDTSHCRENQRKSYDSTIQHQG